MDLKGKTVVITGAGGVICGHFARVLGAAGARVALLDLDYGAADEIAREIVSGGGTAKAYQANVLDKNKLKERHEAVLADFGRCSVLINGAGGNNKRATTDKEYYEAGDIDADTVSFFDLDEDGVRFVFNLNFIGTLLPTQVFAADMLDGGCIVNISSMNAFTPLTKIPAYSAAKAGISNFTQWLAVHFSRVGIRVNALAPGFFVTKQNEKLLFDDAGKPTPRTGKILAATPMGRFGKVEELDGALEFFLDETKSGFVTGVVLPIDGGFSAYSGV